MNHILIICEQSIKLIDFVGGAMHVFCEYTGLLHATYIGMFHCVCYKILVWAIRVHFGSYLQKYIG